MWWTLVALVPGRQTAKRYRVELRHCWGIVTEFEQFLENGLEKDADGEGSVPRLDSAKRDSSSQAHVDVEICDFRRGIITKVVAGWSKAKAGSEDGSSSITSTMELSLNTDITYQGKSDRLRTARCKKTFSWASTCTSQDGSAGVPENVLEQIGRNRTTRDTTRRVWTSSRKTVDIEGSCCD